MYLKNTTKLAETLLAGCDTPEDTQELVTGLLDTLQSVGTSVEVLKDYMNEIDDDGEMASPALVHDRLEEITYAIEDALMGG